MVCIYSDIRVVARTINNFTLALPIRFSKTEYISLACHTYGWVNEI